MKQLNQGLPFTYFISDLHLSPQHPEITRCFLDFLEHEASASDALYILGDLFEVWIGDDNVTEFSETIAHAIATLKQKIPVYFIHGNRDFAIGEEYATKAGMQILNEQTVIDLYGEPVVILHGDELCTRDVDYQKFRKKARGWWWPKMMRAIPLLLRKKIAARGRKKSIDNQKYLSADIMDVTQSEVLLTMQKHNVKCMIHGHTHRPNTHHFQHNGTQHTRIVLGDWYDQGSILMVSRDSKTLRSLSF